MSRFQPEDDGIPLKLTERDLMWFEKLHRHGPLPSRHLYAFSRLLTDYKSDQKSQERLEHLTSRKDTPHKGAYLYRPEEQRATDRALSNFMVHDLTKYGKQALGDRLRDYVPTHAVGRQWMHDFMLSCFTASIELATLADPRYTFIFHDEIVAPLKGKLAFDVTYHDDKGRKQTRLLRPDRAFGIKYPNGKIRRFLVEADRGTEQQKSAPGRKSLEDNLYQYTEFIGEGLYRNAMQVDGGVVVIFLMTSPGKMLNTMMALNDMTGGCNYIAFKAVDGFGHVIKPPPPMPELFTEPFERAGKESFFLNK